MEREKFSTFAECSKILLASELVLLVLLQTNMLAGSGAWSPVIRGHFYILMQYTTRTLLMMQHTDLSLALMWEPTEQLCHKLSGQAQPRHLNTGKVHHTVSEMLMKILSMAFRLRLHFGSFASDWIGYGAAHDTYSFTLQPGEVITGVTVHHGSLMSNISGGGIWNIVSAFTFHTNTGERKQFALCLTITVHFQ